MKKTYILLALTCVILLSGCVNTETSTTEEESTIETNISETNTDLTGEVIISVKNNHDLAGKTLIFDVEIMKITKSQSGTTDDSIKSGDNIEVHYTGTLEDGEVFDSSRERDQTLPFTVGAGQMIAGFDAGVVGMKLGESKVMTLAPEDAYGPEYITQTVPMNRLSGLIESGAQIKVGEKIQVQGGEIEILNILK